MDKTELRIDPEFEKKIPAIGEEEFKQLRENILTAGEVFEPIVVWNGIIVDGHNRWKVIQEHPEVKWRTREIEFADKWHAFDWMYKNQLGRRNLTDEQRTDMIGKLYAARKMIQGTNNQYVQAKSEKAQSELFQNTGANTAEEVASELGIGHSTVKRSAQFSQGVDAIRNANPEAADKILSGKSGLTKKEVMEIRNMDEDNVEKVAQSIREGNTDYKKVFEEHCGKKTELGNVYDMIKETNDQMLDLDAPSRFNLDDLIEEITMNGENSVKIIHGSVERRRYLIDTDEAKNMVQNALNKIAQLFIKEVHAV